MSIQITLPDGSLRCFDSPVTVAQVASAIAPSLAKSALAGKLNGRLVDTATLINSDSSLSIITDQSIEGVEIIRHSTAHLLAHAVKILFPDAQVTIGPVIDKGFYYDFSYKRSFTNEDLALIEAKMIELSKQNHLITRKEYSRDEAIDFFKQINEWYKADIIASIPIDQPVSLYSQGEFTDLCRGPHVPNTGKLKVFKLMKLAGAYWRGDSKNEMLQRIYGTAWAKKEDQETYLNNLLEAEKRDHRKLGRELHLFHIDDHAPGTVFWHPNGWRIWQEIEQYMRQIYQNYGYQEVKGPQIIDKGLWEKTGHWDKYRDNMFITDSEKREYALKPMNCPGHILIYNQGLRSYKDLPLRFGEFGQCHRNEPSGGLHGIMRVRGFTQDDGHIFCTHWQLESEVINFHTLVMKVYADFGFTDITVKLATRPTMRIGSEESWDFSENALRQAILSSGVILEELPGEGAFYGPKIEYHLRDSLGRSWQCGTMQIDSNMPERLGAEYVDSDNSRKVPMMLHRAILGSLERFIGILTEHYAGAFPAWLAPYQVVVCNISESSQVYAEHIAKELKQQGFRSISDTRGEKITLKIREHSLQKLPFIVVVGDKEAANNHVSVRGRGGIDLGNMTVTAFKEYLNQAVTTKQV